jgi:hypothetical protein
MATFEPTCRLMSPNPRQNFARMEIFMKKLMPFATVAFVLAAVAVATFIVSASFGLRWT